MGTFPKNLEDKINSRQHANALRQLGTPSGLVDFSSNDYLGFSRSEALFKRVHEFLAEKEIVVNGATGSRLITGNYSLYSEAESHIASFHQSESALIFNSGYDANLGFFSSVPQRGDIVLFDELCHASIRDGIRLGHARSFKFPHNDYEALEQMLQQHSGTSTIYIATESVFSMDGDSPHPDRLTALAEKYNALLVIDEAHALGVFGEKGEGLFQYMGLHEKVFARIMTFGKGLGCHGAAILGAQQLSDYLVNFARSFIYTTGLPPHSVASILVAYQHLGQSSDAIASLRDNILHFNQEMNMLGLKAIFVKGKSAIQSAIIPGNEKVKSIAANLQQHGFDVRAILSPTVPEGQERLRICLHSYNTSKEIENLLKALSTAI